VTEPSLEDRLAKLERRLDEYQYFFDLLFDISREERHKLWMLQGYTVGELAAAQQWMDTMVDGVHKNIHAFREQLSKVFQRFSKGHQTL